MEKIPTNTNKNEGYNNKLLGNNTHAEGENNIALGKNSHVEGEGNIALGENQHVSGTYNLEDEDALVIVGNGTKDSKSNAYKLDKQGNAIFSGIITINNNEQLATLNYVDELIINIQNELNNKQMKITGGASTITSSNLTASCALVSNASGKVAVSDVTSTELGYLKGVTSNVQTQLNGKASTSHTHTKSEITNFPTSLPANGGNASTVNGHTVQSNVPQNAKFTDTVYDDSEIKTAISGKQATITGGASTITSSNLTANRALISNASGKVGASVVTSTELAYLRGLTGNVQTQLNGKASTNHTHTKEDITDFPSSMKNPNSLTIKGNGTILTDGTYDGSVAKTVNITPSSIGAAASSHGTHVTFTTTLPKVAGTASVGSATTVSRSDHVHPVQTTVSGNAGSATKLATSRNIDGVSFNGSSDIVHYAVCSSNSNSVRIALNGFKLVTGARVFIKFNHNHTAGEEFYMDINETGSKKVYYGDYNFNFGFKKDRVYEFVYDGTNYQLISSHNEYEYTLPKDISSNIYLYNDIYMDIRVLKFMPVTYYNKNFTLGSKCKHFIGTGVPAAYDFTNFAGTTDTDTTVLYNCQLAGHGDSCRYVFENINFHSVGVPLINESGISGGTDYENTCYVFKNCNFFVSSDGGNGTVSTSSIRLMTLVDSSVIFDNCNFYADTNVSGDCLHMIDISRNKTNNYPVCIEVNNCKMIHRDTSTTVDVVFATTNGRDTMISINNSYIEGFNPLKATSNFYVTGPYGLKINNCEFKNVGTIGNVSTYTAITSGHITITNNTFHNYVSNEPITLYGYGDNCIISNNSFRTYDTTSDTGVNIYLHGNLNVFSNNVSNGYMKLYEDGKGTITGNIAGTITQPTSLTTAKYIKTGNFPAIS